MWMNEQSPGCTRRGVMCFLVMTLLVALLGICAVSCANGTRNTNGEESATDASDSATDSGTDEETGHTDHTEESGTTAPDVAVTESETEFTLVDPTTVPKAEMPRVDIKTEGGVDITDRETYVRATVSLSRCDEVYTFTDSAAGIRVRGNSTAGQRKKPYRIKFDTKQSFLGLNEGEEFKSWCLMADYFDPSLLRTWVTFEMAEALLEGKYYSADCAPVEVYLNGVYHGVYLLCEQTQIDRDRVDIYEKEDGETSVEIGYLLIGQGGRSDEPETVFIKSNVLVVDRTGASAHYDTLIFALSGSGYTEAQKAYVSNYVAGVYKVINSAVNGRYLKLDRNGHLSVKTDFVGTTEADRQRETIAAVFDLEAAARMCVLDEIVKNLDAMTFNMYVDLSPEGDGRLTLAAPWDFDFALGNCRHDNLCRPEGYYATNLTDSGGAGLRVNPLYAMLMRCDWFEAMVRDVWKAHYNDLRTAVNGIAVNTHRYADAYARDYVRWGTPGTHFNWDHHDHTLVNSFNTHPEAAGYMHDWLVRRVAWLERRWGKTADEPAPREPLLEVDFTDSTAKRYVHGPYMCRLQMTEQGLHVAVTDKRDPYFFVTFTDLEEVFRAEDYPILEITCLIPSANADNHYSAEVFLCAGSVVDPKAGVSMTFRYEDDRDVAVTYRIDLSATGYWEGDIHRIRLDFDGSEAGDVFCIQSVKLLPC